MHSYLWWPLLAWLLPLVGLLLLDAAEGPAELFGADGAAPVEVDADFSLDPAPVEVAGDLPVGAVLLWLLGQIAVYGPARKAASVPPAVATRST